MSADGTLVLGIGNLLLGDEGIGVHAVRALQGRPDLPPGVELLDGGTGSLVLLEPMQTARRLILIDASADDAPPGTVTRLVPRFAKDFPPSLTAHDIGLKDLLDSFYLLGRDCPDVVLFAVTIDPNQELGTELSPPVAATLPVVVAAVMQELACAARESHV